MDMVSVDPGVTLIRINHQSTGSINICITHRIPLAPKFIPNGHYTMSASKTLVNGTANLASHPLPSDRRIDHVVPCLNTPLISHTVPQQHPEYSVINAFISNHTGFIFSPFPSYSIFINNFPHKHTNFDPTLPYAEHPLGPPTIPAATTKKKCLVRQKVTTYPREKRK